MFTKPLVTRVGFITAALLAIASASAEAQTTLRYQYKEGDKLNYTMDQTQKQAISVMGMDIETSTAMNMEMTWNVKSVKDKKAQVSQTMDRIKMKMDSAFAAFDYDSKDGKEPEGPVGMILGPLFAAMVGAEVTVTTNEIGEVSDTKVSDKLVDALKTNPALAQMGGAFSEEGLKNMFGQSSGLMLPKDPVKKGDTWDQKMELKMPPVGIMKMHNKFTYMGSEERGGKMLEKIDVKIDLTIAPIEDPNQPFEIKVKSSEMKGTMYFDNKAGRLAESVLNTKMAMEINAMGNVIDSSMDQTVTLKLAK